MTEYGAFFGLKITLKIQGGWNTFSGGDIKTGIDGMYDNGVASISASGRADHRERQGIQPGRDSRSAEILSMPSLRGSGLASGWRESAPGRRATSSLSRTLGALAVFRVRPHVKVSHAAGGAVLFLAVRRLAGGLGPGRAGLLFRGIHLRPGLQHRLSPGRAHPYELCSKKPAPNNGGLKAGSGLSSTPILLWLFS